MFQQIWYSNYYYSSLSIPLEVVNSYQQYFGKIVEPNLSIIFFVLLLIFYKNIKKIWGLKNIKTNPKLMLSMCFETVWS